MGGLQREVDSKSAKDTVLKNSFSPTQSTISGIILPTSRNCWLLIYITRRKKRKVKSKGNLAQQMVKSMLQQCLISSCFLSSLFLFAILYKQPRYRVLMAISMKLRAEIMLRRNKLVKDKSWKQTQTGNLPVQVRASSISVWENTLPVVH